MISAQTDQTAQEHLIEKYMSLPNQVWDSIITQATQVCVRSVNGKDQLQTDDGDRFVSDT